MIRADQQRRTLSQSQLLHDRLGKAQWLVGHHAPDQLGLFDIGQQFTHAVKQLAVHGAANQIALKELQTQFFEARRLRVHRERHRNHRFGAAGDLVADVLVVDRRQAAICTHGLADGDEVRRRVE
ncbi:hypothetical protein D3C72_1963710 [compost metagenome]